MIQDDELRAGLDVACIVFCQTLVETLVGLDQAQNLQVVLLLPNTQDQKRVISTRRPCPAQTGMPGLPHGGSGRPVALASKLTTILK